MPPAGPQRRPIIRGASDDRPVDGRFRILSWRPYRLTAEWFVERDSPSLEEAVAAARALADRDGVPVDVVDAWGVTAYRTPMSKAEAAALRRPTAVTTIVERAFGGPKQRRQNVYNRRW